MSPDTFELFLVGCLDSLCTAFDSLASFFVYFCMRNALQFTPERQSKLLLKKPLFSTCWLQSYSLIINFDIRAVFLSYVPTGFFSFFSKLSMSIIIELLLGLNNDFESLPAGDYFFLVALEDYRLSITTKLFDPADRKSSTSLAVQKDTPEEFASFFFFPMNELTDFYFESRPNAQLL